MDFFVQMMCCSYQDNSGFYPKAVTPSEVWLPCCLNRIWYCYRNAVDRELKKFRYINGGADRACNIEIVRYSLLVSHDVICWDRY
jgi:hypothetical protein